MAVKTAEIRARVEPKLKKESMKVLKKLGLSESEGIRLLLKGLVIHQGIPFEFKVPNEETIRAIEDAEKGNTIGPFNSIEELMKELES
ncbi:MAG: type II toxin-antitoxin system RelB/DinJ family antitoxin [Bacteroidetes bacterium]|nr:type II toxin-antitoxin system RelB/DinJ family antitoxin [Bacteroidota bacterium]